MTRRLERFSTMSVLVVDDDQATVDLLKTLLNAEGLFRVTTETDSRRVAALLSSVNPDLVILDLHMPHLDGLAVLKQSVKFAAGYYLPVLVLTSDISTDARDQAFELGARDYLTKPLDFTEVTLRVGNLLETRQQYAELRRTLGRIEDDRELDPTIGVRIEEVLNERSITPVFQRIVDIDNRITVGHEALARFPHDHERGPAGWFSDAFGVGLGIELEWLAATSALPFLGTASPETFLALNMSAATILHLREQKLSHPDLYRQIVIELTEHVPVEDYVPLQNSLREMRGQGTRLAIDDFGSGYGGFRHLIALSPDIIKLDISLVRDIHRNHASSALTRGLVAFANDVGAIVIAEGVEHADELAELRNIGIHWAQGYYLGRPGPSPDGAER